MNTSPPYNMSHVSCSQHAYNTGKTLTEFQGMQTSQHKITIHHSVTHSSVHYSIQLWNTLSLITQNRHNLYLFMRAVSTNTMRYAIRKQIRHYSIGGKVGNKLSTRLRLKTSDPNAHLFEIQFTLFPHCRCGYKNE